MRLIAVFLLGVSVLLLLCGASFVEGVRFFLLAFPLCGVSAILSRYSGVEGHLERFVAAFVIGASLVVLIGIALGMLGGYRYATVLLAGWILLLAVGTIGGWRRERSVPPRGLREKRGRDGREDRIVHLLLAGAAVLHAVNLAVALFAPPTAFDAISYHLTFAAKWLQEGRLVLVPTPFGAEASAYAPANGSLFFLWLMLPFHHDLLAKVGQFPFLVLSMAALFAIGRARSGSARAALWPVLFFSVTPIVFEESGNAYVDLILGAFLHAAFLLLPVGEEPFPAPRRFLVGLALGLAIGTKVVGLPFGFPLLLLACWKIRRLPDSFGRGLVPLLCGMLLTGGFFYLRNFFLTGNPVYPMAVTLLGKTIFPGAFSREAMLGYIFHAPGVRYFPPIALSATGVKLFPLYLAALLFPMIEGVRGRLGAWWSPLFVTLSLWLLFWNVVPYNSQYRFLIGALGFGWLGLGALERGFGERGRRWLDLFLGLWLLFHLFGRLAPLHFSGYPVVAPPLLRREALGLMGVLFLIAVGGGFAVRRIATSGHRLLAGALLFLGLCALAQLPLRLGHVTAGTVAVARRLWPYERDLTLGWRWIDRHLSGERIAYAGNNLPYPLFGRRLENEVFYININRHRSWRFHDFDRAARRTPGYQPPPHPKPAYTRREADYHAWLDNLAAAGIRYVFVTRIGAEDRKYLDHDAEGFPIEKGWMQRDPTHFRIVLDLDRVKIYERLKTLSPGAERSEHSTGNPPSPSPDSFRDPTPFTY